AHSLACATLIFKARDNRIEVGGVPMDGDIDDVITLIEDLLNALPVVHVRIQDDHTLVRLPQHLTGNGCIVQITEAACSVCPCMMTRRPAQGVGRRLTIENGLSASSRALC